MARKYSRATVKKKRAIKQDAHVNSELRKILENGFRDYEEKLQAQEDYNFHLYEYLLKCEAVLKQNDLFELVSSERPEIEVI